MSLNFTSLTDYIYIIVAFFAAFLSALWLSLVIYLVLRPPRTLAEAYEQSLEEEALLQDIEDKRICPGCGRHAQEAWLVCPNCYTKLKKPCAHCGQLLDLPWNLCPYCAAPVEGTRAPEGEPVPASETLAG